MEYEANKRSCEAAISRGVRAMGMTCIDPSRVFPAVRFPVCWELSGKHIQHILGVSLISLY